MLELLIAIIVPSVTILCGAALIIWIFTEKVNDD